MIRIEERTNSNISSNVHIGENFMSVLSINMPEQIGEIKDEHEESGSKSGSKSDHNEAREVIQDHMDNQDIIEVSESLHSISNQYS